MNQFLNPFPKKLIQWIYDKYPSATTDETRKIAQKYGRTIGNVVNKAHKLGIKKNPEIWKKNLSMGKRGLNPQFLKSSFTTEQGGIEMAKKSLEKFEGKDKIVGRPIRLNRQRLEPIKNEEYAAFIAFGDLHYGIPECDLERAKKMLDYCLNTNTYVFLMGDLIDSAVITSPGREVWRQRITPGDQLEFIIELFRPLAEKGLILGSLIGNHEARVETLTGINTMKVFCKALKIPYLGDACWNLFYAKNQSYTIYALHGRSWARYVYTKIKALVDIAHTFDADLMLMGHVHELSDDALIIQYVDRKSKIVQEKKRFLCLTGHYTKYDESFAQTTGMPITKKGSPKIKLYTTKHDIHISV